jgi:hypothetical protein
LFFSTSKVAMDNQQAYLGYVEMEKKVLLYLLVYLGLFGDEGTRDFVHVVHTPQLSVTALLDNA